MHARQERPRGRQCKMHQQRQGRAAAPGGGCAVFSTGRPVGGQWACMPPSGGVCSVRVV